MEKEKLIEQLKQEQRMIGNTLDKEYIKMLPFEVRLFGDSSTQGETQGELTQLAELLECESNIITNKIRMTWCRIVENIKNYHVLSIYYIGLMENHIKVLEKICTESLGIATEK